MKKHYMGMSPIGIGMRYTACGRYVLLSRLVDDRKRVTCKSCKKTYIFGGAVLKGWADEQGHKA